MRQRTRKTICWVAWVSAIIILVPVFYVASIGPACYLMISGTIPPNAWGHVFTFYTPLTHIRENWKPFDDFVDWYAELFFPLMPLAPDLRDTASVDH